MVDAGGLAETVGGYFGIALGWIIWGVVIIVALGVAGGAAYWAKKKKKWNLRVEIKMPRSDGQIINSEKAKGFLILKVDL